MLIILSYRTPPKISWEQTIRIASNCEKLTTQARPSWSLLTFLTTIIMATKFSYKTTFDVDKVLQPTFTGGSVALDNGARILATTLDEDAVLTDLATGKLLARIEGVRP